MRKYSSLLCLVAITIASSGTSFGQVTATNSGTASLQQSTESDAYDAVISLIDQAEKQDGYVSNGGAIFDLGMKAFVAFPEDDQAKRVLTYLGLLPEMLSESDRKIYEGEYRQRIGALFADAGLPEKVKEGLMYMGVWYEAAFLYLNPAVSKADLAAVRAKIDALESRHLASQWIAADSKWLEVLYGDLLTKVDSIVAKNLWEKLSKEGDPDVTALAVGKLNFLDLKLHDLPMDIEFTAADGRHVDLRDLRGKVVLIDFWATWCPFCIAELPSLKKAYDDYHAQGFEVVCISCEYAGIGSNDSDEVRAKKLDAARMKLLRFVRKWNLPWPQYYDGMGLTPNKFAERFGVDSCPGMFLLDRDGRLAETNDPGIKFEVGPLVQRLLASPMRDAKAGQGN